LNRIESNSIQFNSIKLKTLWWSIDNKPFNFIFLPKFIPPAFISSHLILSHFISSHFISSHLISPHFSFSSYQSLQNSSFLNFWISQFLMIISSIHFNDSMSQWVNDLMIRWFNQHQFVRKDQLRRIKSSFNRLKWFTFTWCSECCSSIHQFIKSW
jgi:hypothetical protein